MCSKVALVSLVLARDVADKPANRSTAPDAARSILFGRFRIGAGRGDHTVEQRSLRGWETAQVAA